MGSPFAPAHLAPTALGRGAPGWARQRHSCVTQFPSIQQRRVVTMTPKDVIDLAKEKEAKVVDIRFTDLVGQVQHFSIPAAALDEDKFTDGLAFDGSSIRGFKAINESDMILIPDPDT